MLFYPPKTVILVFLALIADKKATDEPKGIEYFEDILAGSFFVVLGWNRRFSVNIDEKTFFFKRVFLESRFLKVGDQLITVARKRLIRFISNLAHFFNTWNTRPQRRDFASWIMIIHSTTKNSSISSLKNSRIPKIRLF